jgi:hypothetical protein
MEPLARRLGLGDVGVGWKKETSFHGQPRFGSEGERLVRLTWSPSENLSGAHWDCLTASYKLFENSRESREGGSDKTTDILLNNESMAGSVMPEGHGMDVTFLMSEADVSDFDFDFDTDW